jgi:uncharacterized heparinase superfamily protein
MDTTERMLPAAQAITVRAHSASGLCRPVTGLYDDETPFSIVPAMLRAYHRSSLYRRAVLDGPVPRDILRSFPCHVPGDRTQAEAILDESFLFYGKRVPFGAMPWSVLPPGVALAAALHGFSWLVDLKAVGSDAACERARRLVMDWIHAHRRWSVPAWSAAILGRRLASWLACADFFLAGAHGDERARILESAGRQARHLAHVADRTRGTPGAFDAISGEVAAALGLGIVRLDTPLHRLDREIERQIAPDGGHVLRNPAIHLRVFQNLIDLRAALIDAGERVSPTLADAIERMAPMLRAFRHGDGRLALFHGAKESDRTLIDSVLAASRVGAPARVSAPDTGFERLAAGRSLVLIDVGAPPANGHAAPLAFEMSHGRERLIVNCGTFAGDDDRWRAALRSTPAHSTLTVEDANAQDRGWLGVRPVHVSSARQESEASIWIEASHDGYRRRFGLVHRRRLYLGEAGIDLRGEDCLEGRRGRRFHLRFHVHPDVQTALSDDGLSVSLRTASGLAWRFFAVGGRLGIEESTYLGVADRPHACRQIVVAGITEKHGARVKWALRQDNGA